MKIALGTTSAYKGRMLKHVLARLDLDPEIAYCDISSEVSDQPMKSGETKLGSYNRARNALGSRTDCELGCGIEFGYEPEGDDFLCVVYVCLIDKNGKIFYGHSSSFMLPLQFKKGLLAGQEIKNMYLEWVSHMELSNIHMEVNAYMRKDGLIVEALKSVFVSYLAYTI